MDQELADRLATVERAVTDGETDLENVVDGAATADRVADLEGSVEHLEDEVAELDAAVQALRGYVGEIRAVNEEVEETAAAAMATAERAAGYDNGGPAGTEPDRSADTESERPANTEAERGVAHDGEWPAGSRAERHSGTPPAAGQADDRSRAAVPSETSSEPSAHPASAATVASRRPDGTPRQDPPPGSCAGGGETSRTGACPACGRAAAQDAGAGSGPGREPVRSDGDRGLLARVREVL